MQYREAETVFTEIAERVQQKRPGYNANVGREAEYYLGLCRFNMKEYRKAEEHFLSSDMISRKLDTEGPSPFMILANLYLGKIYDMQTKRDLAIKQYEKVLAMDEYLDSHRQAERYLSEPFHH
jgi:tetratricopeptide (TPR) repeat protein